MKKNEREDACLYVPTHLVLPNPAAVYKHHPQSQMDAMRASVGNFGIKTNLTVRQGDDGTYITVDGDRRRVVAKELGLDEIPVTVKSYASLEDEIQDMLHLNHVRIRTTRDILAVVQAWRTVLPKQQGKRTDLDGATVTNAMEQIALYVGEHEKTLYRLQKIAEIHEPLLDRIDEKLLTPFSAEVLARLIIDGVLDFSSDAEMMMRAIEHANPELLQSIANGAITLEQGFKEAAKTISSKKRPAGNFKLAVHRDVIPENNIGGKATDDECCVQPTSIGETHATEEPKVASVREDESTVEAQRAPVDKRPTACCGNPDCRWYGRTIIVQEGGDE